MTNEEALRVVGYLLERNATSGRYAVNRYGDEVPTVDDPSACRWCLSGALYLVGKRCQGRKVGDMRLHFAASELLGRYAVSDPDKSLTARWDAMSPAGREVIIENLKKAGLEELAA